MCQNSGVSKGLAALLCFFRDLAIVSQKYRGCFLKKVFIGSSRLHMRLRGRMSLSWEPRTFYIDGL
jgi:hypothetical protein